MTLRSYLSPFTVDMVRAAQVPHCLDIEYERPYRAFTVTEVSRTWASKDPAELAKVSDDAVVRRIESRLAETRAIAFDALGVQGLDDQSVRHVVDGTGDATTAMKAAQRWLHSGQAVLLLLGGIGVGKSTAAAWAAVQRVEDRCIERLRGASFGRDADAHERHLGNRVLRFIDDQIRKWRPIATGAGCFIRAADLGARVRPWKGDEEQHGPAVSPTTPGLLVIDDLGTESLAGARGERFGEALFDIVDSRQRDGLRTIVTSNLAPAHLRERYEARTIDRLARYRPVVIGGESLRRTHW